MASLLDVLDWKRAEQELLELLRGYLAIDTSHPEGWTRQAADLLQQRLEAEGIATRRLAVDEERPNLAATLPAEGEKRPLVIEHHMDTVAFERPAWRRDPLSGDIVDGEVWGRGALDMKGFGVISIVAMLAIKRLGLPL